MLTWEIAVRKDKSAGWYMTAGVFALALIIWGFIIGLYAMSIVIFIFSGLYIMIENNAPETARIEINENGVSIGAGFYDYAKMEEFAIIFDHGKAEILRLKMKNRGMRYLDVDMNQDVNPAELRAYLSQFLPESETGGELTNTERLMRYLKV